METSAVKRIKLLGPSFLSSPPWYTGFLPPHHTESTIPLCLSCPCLLLLMSWLQWPCNQQLIISLSTHLMLSSLLIYKTHWLLASSLWPLHKFISPSTLLPYSTDYCNILTQFLLQSLLSTCFLYQELFINLSYYTSNLSFKTSSYISQPGKSKKHVFLKNIVTGYIFWLF